MTPINESPGALAGATGAKQDKKAANFHLEQYRSVTPSATHFHDPRSGSVEPLSLHGEAF